MNLTMSLLGCENKNHFRKLKFGTPLLGQGYEFIFYLILEVAHGKPSSFTSLSFPLVKVGESNVRILFHCSSSATETAFYIIHIGPKT